MKMVAANLLSEDEDVVGLMLSARWPDGIWCPRCDYHESRVGTRFILIFRSSDSSAIWKCPACLRQFSLTSGTAFDNHKASYGQLLAFLFLFIAEPERSLASIAREVGMNYKSTWSLRKRVVDWLGYEVLARLWRDAAPDKALGDALGLLLTPRVAPTVH